MMRISVVVWRLIDLIFFAVYLKQIVFRKNSGSIEKKLFISLCMVAMFTAWDELFFELVYPLRGLKLGTVVEFLEHVGFFALWGIIFYVDHKYGGKEGDNPKVLVLMGCFPVLSMVWSTGYNLYIDPTWTNQEFTKLARYIGFITWIMLIMLNYLLTILYYAMRKSQKERAEQLLLLQQYEVERRHYEDIEQMEKTIRGVRHDLNNLLSTADILMKEKDYAGVDNLIQGAIKRVGEHEKYVRTGNTAIDSIINLKMEKAKEMEIPIEVEITIPSELDLNYEAMATIFGNLLDNAIEAQEKLPKQDRKIILKMKYMNQMLMVLVANKGEKNQDLTTTKEDTENHGFGISNIRQSVGKMGGSIQFSWEKDWFLAKILLYHVRPKTKNNI